MQAIPAWRRVIRAAGRLAAIYVSTVLVLLVVVGSLMDGVLPSLDELLALWIPLSFVFMIAFLLLAVARRAGFTALWLVALGIWVWLLSDSSVPSVGLQFIGWTILAFPLYLLGVVGAPSAQPGARRISGAIVLGWWGFVAAAYFMNPRLLEFAPLSQVTETLFRKGALIWGPLPFVLGAYEMRRLWAAIGQIGRPEADVTRA